MHVDIEMRRSDRLIIPKMTSFVLISGKVFNPVAISYAPVKDVQWYLAKGGGLTQSADKKRIYVPRMDDLVVVHGIGWVSSSIQNSRLQPDDSIVVPEKIIGSSTIWKDVIAAADVITSNALIADVSGAF